LESSSPAAAMSGDKSGEARAELEAKELEELPRPTAELARGSGEAVAWRSSVAVAAQVLCAALVWRSEVGRGH
jgi:hypothetical protein